MNQQEQQDKAFKLMTMILEPRVGEALAITIDQLAIGAGLGKPCTTEHGLSVKPARRVAEHILETRFGDFPFLIVSSFKGYFRPATEEECNHWWASCHSRIRAIAMRMKVGRVKAPAGGFRYTGGGHFEKVKPHKNDLFE
jgi:hypothetical protein